MELYEKINELALQNSPFIVHGSWPTYMPFEACSSNDDVCWSMFNTDKFIQFLELLNEDKEWKICMYKKAIPIDMLGNYKDYFDWDYIVTYGHITEDFLNTYADKINWDIISSKKHTEQFLEKHIDNINFSILAIYQKLSANFIDKYKDRLNWIDVCMYQPMSEPFIREHIEYITEPCWVNISKYQILSLDFIREFADKLNWKIMSVYQNISDADILEKYDELIDWDAVSYYQPLNKQLIKKYKNTGKLNFVNLVQNPGISFDEELIENLIADSLLHEHELVLLFDKLNKPEWLIEYCIKNYPDIICWNPAMKTKSPYNICVSSIYNLSSEFILRHQDEICWSMLDIKNIEGLPLGLIYKNRDKFNGSQWKQMSMMIQMPEDFIENVAEYVDWYNITNYQKLSEDFIDRHADKIDWETIFLHNELSEDLMIKHADKIHWKSYIYIRPITGRLLIECIDNIRLSEIIEFIDITNDVLVKMLDNCHNTDNIETINDEINTRKHNAYKAGYIIKEFETPIPENMAITKATNESKKENIFKRIFNKLFK